MKIFSWGSNSHGQLGQGLKSEQTLVPTTVDLYVDVRDVVGGGKHTILTSEDGSLFGCGDNDQCQLARDRTTRSLLSFQPLNLNVKITKISCGWDFNLAISEDRRVFGWGGNSFGQLGFPKEKALYIQEPRTVFSDKAIDVGTGLRHSVIVSEEGCVFTSGFGRKGQLGIALEGGRKQLSSFTKVPTIRNAHKVSCGEHHSIVCTHEGLIMGWGDNKFGQLGVDPGLQCCSETPIFINYPTDCELIEALASGWSHNAILTVEGRVILWGRNDYGQLGEVGRAEYWKPKVVCALDGTKQIVLGSNHGVALKLNGKILCWGWNEHGNCGNGTCCDVYEPSSLNTFGYKPKLIGTDKMSNMSDCDFELSNHVVIPTESHEDLAEIPRFETGTLSYDEFFNRFLLRNRPVIFRSVTDDWTCSKLWIKNGSLNVDHFREAYGHTQVPISNCGKRSYNVQEKCTTIMEDYLSYWERYRDGIEQAECLYLKDWHFTRDFPAEAVYRVPLYFASDWLNEYYDKNFQLNDDYRFVYIGPKNSWTPFHADVFTSFSWSANLCGRKKWILLPPGEEEYFRDDLGNLRYDIDLHGNCDMQKPRIYEVIQETGESIFVPSGWHHQVWNLEDAISINHNWINGCNINFMWESMRKNLSDVKEAIADCMDMENWKEQCQLVLSASFGFDYSEFYSLLNEIATSRMESLRRGTSLVVYGNWSAGRNHMFFDLKRVLSIMKLLVEDDDFQTLDFHRYRENPVQFLNSLESFLNQEL